MKPTSAAMKKGAFLIALVLGLCVVTVAALGTASWWIPQTPAPQTSLEWLGDYGVVPPFTLTERSGRPVGLADLRGHVWVADFIYTQCTESCPTQSLEFASLGRELAGTHDVRLVSVTVDPVHDTPEVLRRYAERYGAGDRWWFLTGERREIYCLARDGFRLSVVDPHVAAPSECGSALRFGPAPAWASHGSQGFVMHSARVVLVDRAGRIRAYHLATEPESMRTLRSNLGAVLGEQLGSGGRP